METITHFSKSKSNKLEIRARMMVQGLTMRSWAIKNSFPYTAVEKVISGNLGKYRSPVTTAGKIHMSLVRDGFWPADEEQAP
jgi:hypothetical protein